MTWLSLGNSEWLSEPCSHSWTNPRQCLSFSPAGWADWPLGPVPLTPNSTDIGQKYQAPPGQGVGPSWKETQGSVYPAGLGVPAGTAWCFSMKSRI